MDVSFDITAGGARINGRSVRDLVGH